MQSAAPALHLRRPLLWGLLGLALLALGLLSAQPLSPEGRFALKMIPHHAQAVELARILERRAADQNLRYFARDVAQTQQAQINQMRGWLPWWRQLTIGLERPGAQAAAAMGMASAQEVAELLAMQGPAAETHFLQLMIRHHQGALPMIERGLAEVTSEGLPRRLIEAMGQSQAAEIQTMQRWLAERGGQPLPFDPNAMPNHGH
ncbi:MAG: DUF305 domain-containing protein [Meiothermus sp.]|uniref:DUF305 domain-containing protein n=1 Tax=Meiothermus sp. TaxID=1955249 RepID=UPI0025ED9A58|nr:DUF305 domain-containing protein [Meiothermus sp.]MCS7068504.1 DUF305 domain-containing protein [Meiothermus sp.]MCX7601963.1 DUF305 domain-containing protein [Meiothermus sp.]MDW8425266.1 DUF305 domain-containing protein [Meiothermus sp.]